MWLKRSGFAQLVSKVNFSGRKFKEYLKLKNKKFLDLTITNTNNNFIAQFLYGSFLQIMEILRSFWIFCLFMKLSSFLRISCVKLYLAVCDMM